MTTEPRTGVRFLSVSQAQKEIAVNEIFLAFAALCAGGIEARQNNPPVSPSSGQSWIVGDAPTGVWSGHENEVAYRFNSAWYFFTAWPGVEFFNLELGVKLHRTETGWAVSDINGALVTSVNNVFPSNGNVVLQPLDISAEPELPVPSDPDQVLTSDQAGQKIWKQNVGRRITQNIMVPASSPGDVFDLTLSAQSKSIQIFKVDANQLCDVIVYANAFSRLADTRVNYVSDPLPDDVWVISDGTWGPGIYPFATGGVVGINTDDSYDFPIRVVNTSGSSISISISYLTFEF